MRWQGFAAAALFAALACGVSSPVDRLLGARCDDRDECDDRCLPPASYPGGFCTTSCERTDDCPADAACADREGGACLFRCVMADDCRFLGDGWTCAAEAAREDTSVEVQVCVPSP